MKAALICLLVLLSLLTLAAMVIDKPYVEKSMCVSCKDCAGVCPTDAISFHKEKAVIDSEKCISCNFCVQACPQKAIKAPK